MTPKVRCPVCLKPEGKGHTRCRCKAAFAAAAAVIRPEPPKGVA